MPDLRPRKESSLFIKMVEWGHVPASLRTRNRKPILYDMYFRAFALRENRKALDEALRLMINDRTFGKLRLATLGRRLIRESVQEARVEEVQLRLTGKGLAARADR